MSKLTNHYTMLSTKWEPGDLCPTIQKRIEKLKVKVGKCIPKRSMSKKFQVVTVHGEQFTVNLDEHSCSCRKWNLTGIPYNYAISVIFFDGRDPEDYVTDHFRVDTFLRIYQLNIERMDGPDNQYKIEMPPLLPSTIEKQLGRPRRCRKVEREK